MPGERGGPAGSGDRREASGRGAGGAGRAGDGGRSDGPARRDAAPRGARRSGIGAAPEQRGRGGAAPRSRGPARPPRQEGPIVDDDATPALLDRAVQRELSTLTAGAAELAGRHLVMVARLLDDDPAAALSHARVVRRLAGRLASAREALGLALYRAGEYAEALAELRTARRMTGAPGHLALMADCERGLGRPERALALAVDPDVVRLTPEERAELRIVAAGARRDLGQPEAAAASLRGPDLDTGAPRPWSARLWYAYADCLLEAGRRDEAVQWFRAAEAADADGETDAVERLFDLGGDAANGLILDVEVDEEPANDGEVGGPGPAQPR